MGSGKSTVGKLLAKKLQLTHMDTDYVIEDKYGSIPDIFQTYGEGTFRQYESETLKNTSISNCIISTGGGIVEKEENISFMKSNGIIIYLETAFAEVEKRLAEDKNRPLWNRDKQKKKQLYYKRMELYKQCSDVIITTDNKTIHETAIEVEKLFETS